jgi:hypothetical protein
MNESFITIRDLSEVPEGLRIQHRDGNTSFLRRDNERYAWIEAILLNEQGMSVPWPVRIARSADGVIVNAWVAWGAGSSWWTRSPRAMARPISCS